MKAREFLAHRGVEIEERNLFKQRLASEEIRELAARVGDVRALVAPSRRNEVEGMPDAEVVEYLAADPARLRRPIIDTGDRVLLGFTKAVRQELED